MFAFNCTEIGKPGRRAGVAGAGKIGNVIMEAKEDSRQRTSHGSTPWGAIHTRFPASGSAGVPPLEEWSQTPFL